MLAIEKDTLSVRNDSGICVIHPKPGAGNLAEMAKTFTRPARSSFGDDVVMARVTLGYPSGDLTADEVEANVAKTEGTIVSIRPDRIVVKDDRARGHVTVLSRFSHRS